MSEGGGSVVTPDGMRCNCAADVSCTACSEDEYCKKEDPNAEFGLCTAKPGKLIEAIIKYIIFAKYKISIKELMLRFSTYLTIIGCPNFIPSSCTMAEKVNSCSKLVRFGKEKGASLAQVCETPWNVFPPELGEDGESCSNSTRGFIKDTCRMSCRDQCISKLIFVPSLFSFYAIFITNIIELRKDKQIIIFFRRSSRVQET